MGNEPVDQYSLLHFSTGVVAYFFGVPFWLWVVLHIIFELVENTQSGVHFIDTYLTFWPGGKQKPDDPINSVFDTVFGIIGWLMAYLLDKNLSPHY